MQHIPKISIIIPVYNCEKFISYTLNSIINQSFIDWECILIDDNSSDNVFTILKQYEKNDTRFKVYLKPTSIKKGANASRNFGFEKSIGLYIKWFDCDDIMLPNSLEKCYLSLINNNLDFVISDTINFDHITNEFLQKPFNFDKDLLLINAENFALNKIGWITDDFFGTRKILENIKFNEKISSIGDEYNFFVRLLHFQIKGSFINEILTHRRVRKDSISNINEKGSQEFLRANTIVKLQTANDLVIYNNKELIKWFLSGYMQYSFKLSLLNQHIPYSKSAFLLICKYYSPLKAIAFSIALKSSKYFNKGYNIMKYARK